MKKFRARLNSVRAYWIASSLIIAFGLTLAISDLLFNNGEVGLENPRLYRLVVDVFFFNSLHIPLTFLMILLIPSARPFVQATVMSKHYIAIVVCLVFISLIQSRTISMSEPVVQAVEVINRFLWLLWPLHHTFYQSVGCSLAMNHSILRQPNGYQYRFEKLYLRILWVLLMVSLLAQTSPKTDRLSTLFCLTNLMVVLIGMIAIWIWSPAAIRVMKTLFFFRFAALALAPISNIALWAALFGHGTEYLLVVRSTLRSQRESYTRTAFVFYAMIASVFMVWLAQADFRMNTEIFSSVGDSPVNLGLAYQFVLVFYPILTSIHYLTDQLLFRMKNPTNLSFAGPWLKDLFS